MWEAGKVRGAWKMAWVLRTHDGEQPRGYLAGPDDDMLPVRDGQPWPAAKITGEIGLAIQFARWQDGYSMATMWDRRFACIAVAVDEVGQVQRWKHTMEERR